MSYHLTYLEAVVTGLVQGVTELFPISSLGHNVLLPALVGGSWASTLNVSAKGSPYLAFIIGLHVATALGMIAYFWRDWLRIVRGFLSSLRHRRVSTPDQRLAWLIILGTIPVGIVGLAAQKVVTNVLAKPELAAVFLAVNGVILLLSERMRRARGAGRAAATVAAPSVPPRGPVPGWPAGRPGPEGYSQQPWQQQQQGPGPRYGQDDDWQQGRGNGQPGNGQGDQYGRPHQPRHGGQPPHGGQPGQPPYGGQPGQPPHGGQPGQPPYQQPGQPPHGGQPGQPPYGGQPPYPQPYQQPGQPPYQQPEQYGRAPGRHAAGRPPAGQVPGGWMPGGQMPGGQVPAAAVTDPAVAADRRLATMSFTQALIVGGAQIFALLPGISRDGMVTVAGMTRGLRREDAVRFSFLLSAPVILAAGVLKVPDLTGPMTKGMHGPIIVGSLIAGVSAFLSIRFLTKYFSEDKSLNPFGIYCLIAGLGSLAYLVIK